MTWLRRPRDQPVGHIVARALFTALVISIVTATFLLAVRENAGHLALMAGQATWSAVKGWALPW
jgi:hypothetical protein